MSMGYESARVRILCPKLVIINKEQGFQWLIGSPSFPPLTIVSTFRCNHMLSQSPFSPDIAKESEDLRMLIPKGFGIIGALLVGVTNSILERIAVEVVGTLRIMRKVMGAEFESREIIGAVSETNIEDIQFFISGRGDSTGLELVNLVTYEDHPDKYVWERGCLLFCKLPLKLPVYSSMNAQFDVNQMYSRVIKSVSEKFKDPQAAYVVEALNQTSELFRPLILHGADLDFDTGIAEVKLDGGSGDECDAKYLSCSHFCSKKFQNTSFSPLQTTDIIQVGVLHNRSSKSSDFAAPIAEYIPALEETHILAVEFQLNVLCYAAKDLLITHAVSKLIIPALIDQLNLMKSASSFNFVAQTPKLQPYHFAPSGIVIPITVFYELGCGETEIKQVEIRKALHSRLGLPLDRPLLRIANALNFSLSNENEMSNSKRQDISMLRDVHAGIPSSGVSGGLVSLVQGSYEYHHYLQDGFNDSGWGCAYRSLQTIISWFKLQHYTSIDVPSHREIQKTLVDIGDKDPSFVGSCEWVGAIELSFVLDKLLGVSCKIINVRSGAELPEKCRELSLHFESQGTPIMIGGGVLAYTLLGVDYNDSSGDCAFLILDPHYTGNDDLKKIINGGWCAWKKGIDSKGKHFFLHDKFYNLLLPQRPTIV